MLVCFGLFGLLLYNTVVANAVCSFTYSQKDEIKAISQSYEHKGYRQCEYRITAPKNSYIELNFTTIFGFGPSALSSMHPETKLDPNLCQLPEVVLKEQSTTLGEEEEEEVEEAKVFGKFCSSRGHSHSPSPKVFHSNLNSLIITYIWVESHPSGFTVDFDFHFHNKDCVQVCDGHSCLSSEQLCNSVYDCTDRSDEDSCPVLGGSGASQSTDVDFVKILVIIISVVLMPGLFIIICVVSPCRLRSRMWRRRRRSRDRLEHSQLRPHSQGSEVVYVPTTSQDQLLVHQMSKMRDRQVQMQSVQTDLMLDLPPQIPISRDGEEGYETSQKQLIFKYEKYSDQCCFRAPPNRTVYDRESPPPYYSNSPSVETLQRPPPRMVRDSSGYPVVSRCYSMSQASSVAMSHQRSSLASPARGNSHHRTMSTTDSRDVLVSGVLPTTTTALTPTVSASTSTDSLPYSLDREDNSRERPPDYSGLFTSSNTTSDTNCHSVQLSPNANNV